MLYKLSRNNKVMLELSRKYSYPGVKGRKTDIVSEFKSDLVDIIVCPICVLAGLYKVCFEFRLGNELHLPGEGR